MALTQNKKKTVSKKTAWAESSFDSGPFKGKFWGAMFGTEFFMIVPRNDGRHDYFEVWRGGVVHDETHSPTLAKAKAFAASLVSGAKAA